MFRSKFSFCGICRSDLHTVRNEWSDSGVPTVYPCVPGHEMVDHVTKVGSAVTKFKSGDLAAVGCMVDSDGTCPECQFGLEQYCPNMIATYNSPDGHLGGVTYGGYSESIVVKERFVVRVPSNLDLAGAAPLLCAGIKHIHQYVTGVSPKARGWARSVWAGWAIWRSSLLMRLERMSWCLPCRGVYHFI
jgi:D-arabinose 1-dehydrogenase-like Zn-dependent alcohol dehydrogenase